MSNSSIFKIIATTQGFKKAQGEVKGLSGTMKKFAAGLVSVTAAYKAFEIGLESVQLAGKLEGVEKAFNNMRKEAGFSINTFSKLDNALDGTADKFTIMEQANNAMLLGIAESEEQMAEMFDVAQRLAEAVGQDATFGIESLVTGLGRQSKLMLDNLGIIVDVEKANERYAETLKKTTSQLTDQERKQAFINEAMRQGKTLVDDLGEESDTTARKLQRFSTSVTNLKIAIGDALIESGALNQLDRFTQFINRFTKSDAEDRIDGINRAIGVLQEKNWTGMQKGVTDVFFELSDLSAETQAFLQGQLFGVTENEIAIGLLNEALFKIYEDQRQLNNATQEKIELDKQELELSTARTNAKEIELTQKARDITLTKKFIEIQQEQKRSVFDPSRVQDYNDAVTDSVAISAGAIRDIGIATNAGAKTMEALTISAALADTYAGANKALAAGAPPFNFIAAASVVAAGLANVQSIRQSYNRKQGQTGFEGVIDEPTQFTVGEGGAAEYVSVTPLEGVNNASGQGMTINISGNVMSDQFVEEELAERIQEAVRKGVDFGMS